MKKTLIFVGLLVSIFSITACTPSTPPSNQATPTPNNTGATTPLDSLGAPPSANPNLEPVMPQVAPDRFGASGNSEKTKPEAFFTMPPISEYTYDRRINTVKGPDASITNHQSLKDYLAGLDWYKEPGRLDYDYLFILSGDNQHVYFSTSQWLNGELVNGKSNAPKIENYLISRILKYDLTNDTVDELFKIKEDFGFDHHPIIGIDQSKIILRGEALGIGPGDPCSSIWTDAPSSNKPPRYSYFDILHPNDGIKPYFVPQEKLDSMRKLELECINSPVAGFPN